MRASPTQFVSHLAVGLSLLFLLSKPAEAFFLEYYGSRGGFQVGLNEHAACVAAKETQYEDIDGSTYQTSFSFGVVDTYGTTLALIAIWSPSFNMQFGDARRGEVEFDGVAVEGMFVADDRQILSVYMDVEQLYKVATSYDVVINLFDGTYIEMPLDGTAAASELVLECYERELAPSQGGHDPLRGW